MPFAFAILGAIFGYFVVDDSKGWMGSLAFAAVGAAFGLAVKVRQRVDALTRDLVAARGEAEAARVAFANVQQFSHAAANDLHWRLARLEQLAASALAPAAQSVAVAVAVTESAPAPAPESQSETESETESQSESQSQSESESQSETESTPTPTPTPAPAPTPTPTPTPSLGPSPLSLLSSSLRSWLLGGNTILRVGSLLLFLGLAFALRYAAAAGYFPVELRYACVAAASLGLTGIGFALRRKRRDYGLVLQGVGIGATYLTVFAAMRLQELVPLQMGLVLLILVSIASAVLAVGQNAVTLANAAALGGFAAPILASRGGGSHVALFSYLLLLDLAIVGIAWVKAWRSLNLIGFLGTFGIGTAWGVRVYEPPLYGSTQPFVAVAFLVFVAVAVLFARRVLLDATDEPASESRADVLRWARAHAHAADATLLFGTPLAAFGLEMGLVHGRPFGAAFASLGTSAFYVLLAGAFVRARRWRYLVLVETFVVLGVLFATLTIPLALEARWTAAAWALEGAALYWMGVRQGRPVSRAFGLLLQGVSAVLFLTSLGPGVRSLVGGSALGAGMIAAALLATYTVMFRAEPGRCPPREKALAVLVGPAGLVFADLVVALVARRDVAAASWAALGLATLAVALRTRDRAWAAMALLVQALAGIVFVAGLSGAEDGAPGVLGEGVRGLLVASAVGGAALASFVLAWRGRVADGLRLPVGVLAGVLLFAVAFVDLGALFVLPWRLASGVWTVTGVLLTWLSLAFAIRAGVWLGVASEVVGGAAFAGVLAGALDRPGADEGHPFASWSFWTPVVIAAAAFVCAHRLHADGRRHPEDALRGRVLGVALLAWTTVFWAIAWLGPIDHHAPPPDRVPLVLLVGAVTTFAWALAARPLRWDVLAGFTSLLSPLAALLLLVVWARDESPFARWHAAAWAAAVAVHFLSLHRLAPQLPARMASALHVAGAWWILGILALGSRAALGGLAGEHDAWRWFGWAVVPLAYVVAMASEVGSRAWPLRDFGPAYRRASAAPVAVVLVLWFLEGSFGSDGSARPLPYVPLVNPLEVGQLLSIVAVAAWFRRRLETWSPLASWPRTAWQWGLGLELLVFSTFAVARVVHHVLGVAFSGDAMLASMQFQAGLSLVWTLAALALMLTGNRSRRRAVWVAGAVLVAIVVAKLFLVELSNRGGLERIVSFVGVGVLLLVVGYFAPLPPAAPSPAAPPPPEGSPS